MDAGNIRTSDDGTITTTYTHDGWNRLVKVEVDSGSGDVTRLENSYNGLNWRISKRGDTDFDGSLDQERIMYYNASWQLLEEVIYDDWSSGSPGSVDENRTYIWGERYIDDLIAIQKDTDVDGNYDDIGGSEMYFCVQDAQFSTVALVDLAGSIKERVTYDAYGEARHHDWRDVDGDGDYDSTDYNTLATLAFTLGTSIGQSNYRVEADLDRDGDNDSADVTLGGTTYPTPLSKGELSLPEIDNPIGYDGYIFSPETEDYTVRYRWYKPPIGRWLQRDPAGYVDGMSLYSYVESRPLILFDPSGLTTFPAGNHHGYPLYLGGAKNAPTFPLSGTKHSAAHAYFDEVGFGFKRGDMAFNDRIRRKWKKLSQAERRTHIVKSLKRAGVSQKQINQHIDAMMGRAKPGVNIARTRYRGFVTRGTAFRVATSGAVLYFATWGYNSYLNAGNKLGEYANALGICKQIQAADRAAILDSVNGGHGRIPPRFFFMSSSGVIYEVLARPNSGRTCCHYIARWREQNGDSNEAPTIHIALHPQEVKCPVEANIRDPRNGCKSR